ELDKRQNMRVMETRYRTCLTSEAASHLTIGSIVTKNHLDSHAPIKRSPLLPLINRPHTAYPYAPDDLIIAKLLAFQRQHRVCLSFPRLHGWTPWRDHGRGAANGRRSPASRKAGHRLDRDANLCGVAWERRDA